MTTHTPTVMANRERPSLLIINVGSSSIRFALYDKYEPLRRLLDGKVDRVGLSGTNLTFRDSGGKSQDSRTIDTTDHGSAVVFLLDWLETQQVFASANAVGHRVVQKFEPGNSPAIERWENEGGEIPDRPLPLAARQLP